MPKDQYMCQLCANHGIFNQPKKGHKQKCPHRTCECNLCELNTKRRALDQIERQLKNPGRSSEFDLRQNESSLFPGLIVNKETDRPSTNIEPSPPSSLAPFKVPPQWSHAVKSTYNNSDAGPSTSKVQQTNNINNNIVIPIPLPATLTNKSLFIKPLPIEKNLKTRTTSTTEERNVKRRRMNGSIFHSAEKLAQSG